MADNPYVNKVEYDGQTLMDLTSDTATPSDVLSGVTFHDRSGAAQTGSLITHNVYDGLDSTSTSDALSANQGKVLNDNMEDFKSDHIVHSKVISLTQNGSTTFTFPTNSLFMVQIGRQNTSGAGYNALYIGSVHSLNSNIKAVLEPGSNVTLSVSISSRTLTINCGDYTNMCALIMYT